MPEDGFSGTGDRQGIYTKRLIGKRAFLAFLAGRDVEKVLRIVGKLFTWEAKVIVNKRERKFKEEVLKKTRVNNRIH